jgi:hypothetical protein
VFSTVLCSWSACLESLSGLPPNRPSRCFISKSNLVRNRLQRACRRVNVLDVEKYCKF